MKNSKNENIIPEQLEKTSIIPEPIFNEMFGFIKQEHVLVTDDLQRLQELVKESSEMFKQNFFMLTKYLEEHRDESDDNNDIRIIINQLTCTLQMEDLVSQIIDYTCSNITKLNDQLELCCEDVQTLYHEHANDATYVQDLFAKIKDRLNNSETKLELHPVKQKNIGEGDIDLF